MPLLHPAAALRTPSLVDTLREDFAALPELLAQAPPAGAAQEAATAAVLAGAGAAAPEADQLDLLG